LATKPNKEGHQSIPGPLQENVQQQGWINLVQVDQLQLSLHGIVFTSQISKVGAL
jgi:hypothetical protein